MENEEKKQLCIISHTHWDREWYFPFEEYRIRLVRAMDKVLKILSTNPKYKYYNFDGQTVVLEDYLAVKPENREKLQEYIRSGRMLVGPWYILPDEFLVSGEALIRNHLVGEKTSRDYGACMQVGYLPDMFGHIAQMPQLLQGLGLDNAIIWRGISGEPELKSEFWWESPDGSRVLTIHLPDNIGYANAQFMPQDIEAALQKMEEIRADRESVATTPYLLVMNGVDHMPPEEHIVDIIDAVNERMVDCMASHSNFREYVDHVRASVPDDLQVIRGELRDVNRMPENNNINFLFYGVLSSRMDMKLKNDAAQRLFEKYVEPLSSIALLEGMEYPTEFLFKAWKDILLNHPHDNICGCSVDGVSRNMDNRFDAIDQLGRQFKNEAMYYLAGKIDTCAAGSEGQAIVVYNPLPFARSGEVEITVEQPMNTYIKGIRVFDAAGKEIPSKIIDIVKGKLLANNFDDVWPPYTCRKSDLYTLRFFAQDVPGCGYATYTFRVSHKPSRYKGTVVRQANALENEFLRAEFRPNGSFDLTDKTTGRTYPQCNYFEDGGDCGDGYSYSYPHVDELISTLGGTAAISVLEDYEGFGAIRVEHTLRLPEELNPQKTGRGDHRREAKIVTVVSLSAGERAVRIRTSYVNECRDHRLRVLFPSEIAADTVYSDAQFDLACRPVSVEEPSFEAWIENAPSTYPLQNFVDVTDGKAGLAVIDRGIPEYEVLPERGNTIALSLMRSFAKIGNCDALTIKLGGGPEFDAPESQLVGKAFVWDYALYPHAGDTREGGVFRQAFEVNHPFCAWQTTLHEGPLPASGGYLSLSSDDIVMTAMKKAEDGGDLIVRCFNPFDAEVECTFTFGASLAEAELCDLREKKTGTVPCRDGRFTFRFEPHKIQTFRLKR